MNLKKQDLSKIIREYFNQILENQSLSNIKTELASAAQKVYDEWNQDDNGEDDMLGGGGICQDIADAMANILSNHGIECATVSQTVGEQHVYVVAKTEDGVFNVDINPFHYETGGGYNWKKIPDVKFDQRYVTIEKLSSNPEDFNQYIDEY